MVEFANGRKTYAVRQTPSSSSSSMYLAQVDMYMFIPHDSSALLKGQENMTMMMIMMVTCVGNSNRNLVGCILKI